MTPYPDEPLFDGIKSYQRANKLRVDGIMKPDGETMRSLHKTLAQAESHEANKSDQPKTCPEGQYPVNNPICIPKTGLCMDNWVCEPYPSGGGIRG